VRLASVASQTPTSIRFNNKSRHQVKLLWLDYAGNEVAYRQAPAPRGTGEPHTPAALASPAPLRHRLRRKMLCCGRRLRTAGPQLCSCGPAVLNRLPQPGAAQAAGNHGAGALLAALPTEHAPLLGEAPPSRTRACSQLRPNSPKSYGTYATHPWIAREVSRLAVCALLCLELPCAARGGVHMLPPSSQLRPLPAVRAGCRSTAACA
jgi:hypothetical protein